MSGEYDFIMDPPACDWFELIEFVQTFDMGINFLEGPPGPPGPAGEAIFIPSVSSDGVISWTNTAGLPNPDPVNIKGPPGASGGVSSVNGQTGVVTLGKSDVGLGNVANVLQYSADNPPPYPVTSINGQTGAVTMTAADLSALSAAVLVTKETTNGRTYSFTVANSSRFLIITSSGPDEAKGLYIGNAAATGATSAVAVREASRVTITAGVTNNVIQIAMLNTATICFLVFAGSVEFSSDAPTA